MMILKSLSIVAVLALLAGCAVNSDLPQDPADRLAFVKKITQKAEGAAVRLVPEADVQQVRQLDKGTILRCGNQYRWSGNVRIQLVDGVTGNSARDALARGASKSGFKVSTDKLLSGGTRYELIDPEGVQLLVTAWPEGEAIDIDSGSPCFELPKDFDVPRGF